MNLSLATHYLALGLRYKYRQFHRITECCFSMRSPFHPCVLKSILFKDLVTDLSTKPTVRSLLKQIEISIIDSL